MNINLTPKLEEFIQQKVTSGNYNNASEVVRESLRVLEERDQEREAKLAGLRQALQEGRDSGPSRSLDIEAIKRQARSEWEAEQLSTQR
jgi:antitoxin ParD1/3/4